jgi:hypothetical protein
MEPPKERLWGLKDAILAAGSWLRVTLIEGVLSAAVSTRNLQRAKVPSDTSKIRVWC